MQLDTVDLKNVDTTVVNYIKEIHTQYEKRISELQNNYENRIKESEYKYLELKEQYDLLIYKRFARSAEQLISDKKQPLLFNTEPDSGRPEITMEEITRVKSHSRNKSGRKPINPLIERRERVLDLNESDKTCACGAKLTKIGEEVSEKLHIEPPRIYVERIIRPKYACRKCEGTEDEGKPTIRIMPVEPTIIPRSIASASLLATIITYKFEDHLPYNRQEGLFERIGVRISRQDMSNWQQQVYRRIRPLLEIMKETLKNGPVIQMDETTVQVLGEEGREDTMKSRMWLARGGPPGRPVILYKYYETRKSEHVKEILEGYRGYLQTDGYSGYDSALKVKNEIKHVGCFAHVRRKFFEAEKVSKNGEAAKEGIEYIKRLYVIENELRNRNADKKDLQIFLEEREKQARPVLEEFKSWLEKKMNEIPPRMLLGEAIKYTLGQWDKLMRYLESPYLTPDNNACENAIRPFVIGRKNWIFCQSPEGAESSCGMYSLIQTAKYNGIKPFEYLKILFEEAPKITSRPDWDKLLPWNIPKK